MALAYPNRTGETGTYNTGSPPTVTLPGTSALEKMRTFAAAETAGKIADGDTIGVSVTKAGTYSDWAVYQAIYNAAAGTLTLDTLEDQSGTLADADSVEVFATVTDAILSWGLVLPHYFMGPDYWDYANATGWPAPPTYDAGTREATLNGDVNVNGTWNEGFTPARIAFEIFTPIDATNILPGYFDFRLNTYEGDNTGDWQASDIIAGLVPGDWAAFDFATSSSLTGDPSFGIIEKLRGSVNTNDDPSIIAAWKLRKLRFY